MYAWKDGKYTNDDCNVLKSVRLDRDTIEAINAFHGRNFSDKLRNLIREYTKDRNTK